MIFDRISEWPSYRGLAIGVAGGLEKAFEYLQHKALEEMPDGRHEIDGDRVFLLLSTSTSEPESKKKFESHRLYLDIQVVLKGNEVHYWAPISELAPQGEYSAEKDIIFYEGSSPSGLLVSPGRFALYLPADAHKPGCRFETPQEIRKAVFKVRL